MYLKVGSWSSECIIIFANLFSKLSESTSYKEKVSVKGTDLKVLD